MMDSGSDPIPDAKSADFEYCGGRDAPCLDRLVIRSSDFGFYTQMISVKREILIDDDSLPMRCRVTGWKMLICLRVSGDLVENAELPKVNQPQIPQAYQCNLLEKCCYTSGRSWHANPFPNPNCNKLGKNSNVSLSVKHVLNKI